jgi:pilus assembly protein Flp/PilA
MRNAWSVPPVKKTFFKFLSDESGVTAIEYGVIAALIAVVIIGAVSSLGTHIKSTFNSVAASL